MLNGHLQKLLPLLEYRVLFTFNTKCELASSFFLLSSKYRERRQRLCTEYETTDKKRLYCSLFTILEIFKERFQLNVLKNSPRTTFFRLFHCASSVTWHVRVPLCARAHSWLTGFSSYGSSCCLGTRCQLNFITDSYKEPYWVPWLVNRTFSPTYKLCRKQTDLFAFGVSGIISAHFPLVLLAYRFVFWQF